MVFKLMTSHVLHVWVKIHYSSDVIEAVMYPVHHHHSCIAPSLLQAGPPKQLQHRCDVQITAVLQGDNKGCLSLDHFELVDVIFGIRVQDCGVIFHNRLDYGLVVPCFNNC